MTRTQKLEDTTIGWRFVNPAMLKAYGIDTMPETAENVARAHGISRESQDAFAMRSQSRAAASATFCAGEIVPVPTVKSGSEVLVVHDEHLRETSQEALGRLRPVVGPDGTVTAGNASGIDDGAAVLLLASAQAIERYGLVPRARVLGMASADVEPRVMGIGPVPATRKLLARLGWPIGDCDTIELNEAFAAQALALLRGLGLADDAEHVNPNDGAIALGHPLGMSGARLALTAMRSLEVRSGKRALVTLCVGVGQGVSLAMERI